MKNTYYMPKPKDQKEHSLPPKNEGIFKDMFFQAPTPMWIFDMETLCFLEVNDAALSKYQYSREEFLSMTVKDIRPEEDIEALIKDVAASEGRINYPGVWRHRKKNGEIVFMEIASHPITFDGRNARYILASDVTEKRNIEQSLKNSEARFRSIVERAPEPIFIKIDGAFAYLNSAALKLLKANDFSDLKGKRPIDLVHPDFRKLIYDRDNSINKEDESSFAPDEIKIIVLDGSELWIEAAEQPIEYEGEMGMLVFIRDITNHKKNLEAISYQEYLLKQMGRIAKIGGWEFDPETGKGTWTEEVARIHGMDIDGTTSREMGLSFYTDESRIRIEKAITDTMKNHSSYDLELEIILENGIHKWVHTFGQPVIEDGKVIKIRGAFQDITQHKVSENILIESEEKYRAIFEHNIDAMLLSTPEGKIIEANQAACKLFGYTEAELKVLGRDSIIDRLHKDEEPDSFIEGRESNGDSKSELTIIRKDGQAIQTEISFTIFNDAAGQRKISIIIRDITVRKLAEKALKESKRRYRNLLQVAPVGIAVIANQLIAYINPKGIKLLGAKCLDELVGKNITEILGTNVDLHLISHKSITNKSSQPKEWSFNRVDHKTLNAEVMVSGLEYEGNPAIQIIFNDITERKKAEDLIRHHNVELEKRIEERTAQLISLNQDLEAFAYSVSHDLRTPLRGINGLTQILQEKYTDTLDEEGAKLCYRIRVNSLKMSTLIEDLLAFSKASTLEVHKVKVNMNKLVREAIGELGEKEALSKIKISIDDLPSIKGDAILLKQVWINLISNAIKFTSHKEHRVIEITGEKKEINTIYQIKDNGAGFDMAYVDKLFAAFKRLHSEQEFQGTGAGLAIVQRIILKHGGRIWAEGEVEKGATFTFALPV